MENEKDGLAMASDSGGEFKALGASTADGIKKKFTSLFRRMKKVKELPVNFKNSDAESQGQQKKKEHVTDSHEDVRSCVSSSVRSTEISYNLDGRNRGLAVFIINSCFEQQKNRKYAEVDERYMTELFEKMGFEIRCLNNRTTKELREGLIDIQKSITKEYDCLVVIISSHGAEVPLPKPLDPGRKLRQHVIFTSDYDIPTNDILKVFNDDYCPNLEGKPRMFFIQACRSVMGADEEFDIDKGVDLNITKVKGADYAEYVFQRTQNPPEDTSLADAKGAKNLSQQRLYCQSKEPTFCFIPCFEEYLVMFSSASERIAWSNDNKGGWLLYCLYEMFKRLLFSDFKAGLLQILSAVSGKMAREMRAETSPSDYLRHGTKSAAIIHHMLTKNICLQPKYKYTYEVIKETAL